MAVKKQGFEGLIYYGTAGSTAATQITNSRDISETIDIEEGDTTVRGAGSSPPIKTSRVTGITYGLDWQMVEKSDDTTLTALKAAAVAGTPIAIRTKSYASGTGYDGDMVIKFKKGTPLKGEQTYDFTGVPNDDNRTPQLNA
jgi:Tfp pilus assembly major pilin PilA